MFYRKETITPIPMKHRAPFVHVCCGNIHVENHAFCVEDKNGTRKLFPEKFAGPDEAVNLSTTVESIPVGAIAAVIVAEPGVTISHAAIDLAGKTHTNIIFAGEKGVRFYSFGSTYSTRSNRMYRQAAMSLDPVARVKVARKMFEYRFGAGILGGKEVTIQQLRGFEGARVKTLYIQSAKKHGVSWQGRNYNREDFGESDEQNQAISAATSCLYGVVECAVHASGLSPAFGFVHCGNTRAFVFDIADLFRMETVVDIAFRVVGRGSLDIPRDVRKECRDMFERERFMEKIVGVMDEILDAGGHDEYRFSDDMILVEDSAESLL